MVRIFFASIAAVWLAGCASIVAPNPSSDPGALRDGQYKLDPVHASVSFKVDHLGFSNYVGRFELLDASLDFDADDPANAKLEALVDIASLDIANDEFAATLTGPDWFDAAAHPKAVYRSRSIEITGENTGVIAGDLTLRGVTQPMALDVTFNGGARDLLRGGYVVGFSAVGTIDRTAHGVDRFSGVVGDEVLLEIEAEFIRQ